MNRLHALVACLLALLCAGCDSTPTQRWAASSEALITARTTVLTLHSQAVIDDAEFVRMDRVEKLARGALDVAKSQLPDGGDSFEEWLTIATGALRKLALSYQETVIETSRPETVP